MKFLKIIKKTPEEKKKEEKLEVDINQEKEKLNGKPSNSFWKGK